MDRRAFLSLSGAAGTVAAGPGWAATPETATPARRVAPDPVPTALALPNLTLWTHENKKVRLYDDLLKDKIFLINMFFVACTDGQCPLITANLARVQPLIGERLGRDIFMYSISLNPVMDTPESLHAYVKHFNVRPGWLFLTGDKDKPDEIEHLRKALGYWDPDPELDKDKTTHIGLVRVGNEPVDRWTSAPTLAEPREIARMLSYVDWPKGWTGRRHRAA
ncbi:electron transporter SenC [Sulfuricaulis limicola]|uniref:Electron transporter SenC n=1 Tax=Sulfuricaulis limicola TaxID=1620215 RepID=A0A1B4XEN9_9GAMM|nr:SCO family protein [Sulfuricaulis limicola]BAV33269.1 electron transporter SenC [Sulfuricaulis limicola]